MPRAEWMSDVVYGSTVRSLLTKKEFVVVGIEWGPQKVKLKDAYDDTMEIRLEKYYEFYESANKK